MATSELLASMSMEPLEMYVDGRGTLYKAFPHAVGGEVYLISIEPGLSRGHHWHGERGEWFAGIQGTPTLVAADPASGERRVFPLAGRRVWVPAGLAHAIFAPADEACLIAGAMELPHHPDDVFRHRLEAP
jgi:oxalate decarboxylase/phosphoglucose isomerase-like protein (cupin superfamily)